MIFGGEQFTDFPENMIIYNGHTYAVYNYKDEQLNSWDNCETFCEARSGHLAVIESQQENAFLYQYLRDSEYHLAFFGYSDQREEENWEWVAGSSSFENWDIETGQPNNGANTYHFICEWDYVA